MCRRRADAPRGCCPQRWAGLRRRLRAAPVPATPCALPGAAAASSWPTKWLPSLPLACLPQDATQLKSVVEEAQQQKAEIENTAYDLAVKLEEMEQQAMQALEQLEAAQADAAAQRTRSEQLEQALWRQGQCACAAALPGLPGARTLPACLPCAGAACSRHAACDWQRRPAVAHVLRRLCCAAAGKLKSYRRIDQYQ